MKYDSRAVWLDSRLRSSYLGETENLESVSQIQRMQILVAHTKVALVYSLV